MCGGETLVSATKANEVPLQQMPFPLAMPASTGNVRMALLPDLAPTLPTRDYQSTDIYQLLRKAEDDADLGGDYFERRDREGLTSRLIRRLQNLGHKVSLEPQPQVA